MPATTRKISKGKNKGKVRVSTPGGVKAKAATPENAAAQKRLLNAVEHGFKPTGKSKKVKKHGSKKKASKAKGTGKKSKK